MLVVFRLLCDGNRGMAAVLLCFLLLSPGPRTEAFVSSDHLFQHLILEQDSLDGCDDLYHRLHKNAGKKSIMMKSQTDTG